MKNHYNFKVKKISFEFKIAIIYVIFGGLWILFSDKLILLFVDDVKSMTQIQTYKGWFYVLATGLLLFLLLQKHLKNLQKAKEELSLEKEKAEEHNELKTAFISNISHEIRTPMNGIIGFSNLLKKSSLPESKRAQYTEYIEKNSKQLMAIVNNLLDISKIETGQIELVKSEFSVSELLNDLQLNFKQIAASKDLDLMFEKDITAENDIIYADKTKLQQILNNLVTNAIKFTESGYIKIGCYFEEQFIKFYVRDTGIGIAADHLDKIFNRFSQIEKGISRKYGGTGLGLAICKSYVELMDGQIWVNSFPAKGSQFNFAIPYVSVEKKIEKEKINQSSQTDWKDYTILVAEDEESNFQYIKELLLDSHVNLIHVENGLDAVEIAKSNKAVNLVLMDIKMPIMNGLEATRKIKETRPDLPIIAQTAFAAGKDREESLSAGCDNYIAKPMSTIKLIELISKYLPR